MALWFIPVIILSASFLGLVIILIFKYAMKQKTFDEAMAEQRKQLALERNLRSKTKHHPSKKQKNISKDHSHLDKRSKPATPHTTVKDAKKVEPAKISNITADKLENFVNNGKKKSDKVLVKTTIQPITPNNPKTNAENIEEDVGSRVDSHDSSIKKKVTSVSKTDDSSILIISDVDNKNVNEETPSVSNAVSNESDVMAKEKLSKANKSSLSPTESNENFKAKNNLVELNDNKQRESKKPISKTESDENISKNGHKPLKPDEKGSIVKEVKPKPIIDEKVNKTEEKIKVEEIKVEEKAPPSPLKSKKIENNIAEIQGINIADPISGDQTSIKEVTVIKTDKSSSLVNAGKKSTNGSVSNNLSNGKMSPISSSKSQKTTNSIKSAKRQTNDIKTLQKLNDENVGPVNVNLLMPLIAKAELSRSEYQNLIDLLLNKQQENCIDAEWIEGGRQDPMVKLKKQLAEKEKALCDEQEAHQAIQSKLKELRTELNVEKHTNRQLEETLNARQMDLQALNARLQSMADEKQNFTKQLQQIQNKLNEERMIVSSLKDENTKTKSNLQHELLAQRQQLELHIAHLNEQHQQEILAFETQLNDLARQLHEQEATTAQMNDEIRDCVLIRERMVLQENQIAHFQQKIIQLEELIPIKADLERHVASGQYEVKRLNNEIQSLTDQLNRRNAEIEKFNCTVQNMKIENQELLKENSRNNEQIKFAYNEKAQLQMENEKLRNELQKIRDQYHSNDDVVRLQNELESYRNAVNDKNVELTRLADRLAELENSKEQYISRTAALEVENKSVNELKESLQKQIKKNDELRSKNWKVMEALSSMEKTLETKVKKMQCLPHEIKTKERQHLIQQLKTVLQNASDVDDSTISNDDIWFSHLEKVFQEIHRTRQPAPSFLPPAEETFAKESNVSMLDELEKQNKQLQTMVSHYKSIISDTEGMLNSLQNHVEQEENRWSEQVQRLQSELNTITEERNSLLNTVKVQNGCVQNEVRNSEQKVNGIDKLPSILDTSSSTNNTMMTS